MHLRMIPPVLFILLMISSSCTKQLDEDTEKVEIIKTVKGLYKSIESEDIDLMSNVMAHDEDMVNFGTDISEHEVGWKIFKEAHLSQFEAIDKIRLSSKDLNLFLSQKGDVAWFSDITDWFLIIGQDSLDMDDVRITGVLEKRDQQWKIVQIHASVPQGS